MSKRLCNLRTLYNGGQLNDYLRPTVMSNLSALLIGINDYPNFERYPALKGCVTDANAVARYLQEELGVPRRNIHRLLDSQATRAEIINELNKISDSSAHHQKDSPILIFYAGHGGLCEAPHGWGYCRGEKIQMLIPYDCGLYLPNGSMVPGIPDYTIARLLNKISTNKGNNVTVIFDTCYSASGTRHVNDTYAVRGVTYRGGLPLDERPSPIFGRPRGLEAPREFSESGLRSHVLLAACNANESAREVHGRGVFTKALLEAMHALGHRKVLKVTYRELMEKVPQLPLGQNPQCEGFYQDRFLFQVMEYDRTQTLRYGISSKTGRSLVIQDTSIEQGDVVAIWKSKIGYEKNANRPDGKVTMSDIHHSGARAENTILGLGPNTHFIYKTLQSTHEINLPIHISAQANRAVEEALNSVIKEQGELLARFKRVSKDVAHVSITQDASGYFFSLNDAEANQHGVKMLRHAISTNTDKATLKNILRGIATYQYHLRHLKHSPPSVSLELCPIQTDNQLGANLNFAEVGIDLVEDGSLFAIAINNNMQCDLYPALFYFDNCDFSIQRLYISPSAGKHIADPPLKRGQKLIITHPSAGGHPFVVKIRQPHPMECGYLKLFISTHEVDFTHIEQHSPFDMSNTIDHKRRGYCIDSDSLTDAKYTGSILVPFVVRPAASHEEARRGFNNTEPAMRMYGWPKLFQRGEIPLNHTTQLSSVHELDRRFANLNINVSRGATNAPPPYSQTRPGYSVDPQQAYQMFLRMERQLQELEGDVQDMQNWSDKTLQELKELNYRTTSIRSEATLRPRK